MEFLDQIGNKLIFSKYPEKIVSLVPSLTELLFDLGLDQEIIGVTEHCVLPENKTVLRKKIGTIQNLNFSAIKQLKPDLIIGGKEENNRDEILRLKNDYNVWISDVANHESALTMIRSIGEITNRTFLADLLVREISMSLESLPSFPIKKAAYLIWKNPFMAAGGNTYINDMLGLCGFENISKDRLRYPITSLQDMIEADYLLLSSEPFSFNDDDIDFFNQQFSEKRAIFVDGRIFSWYGSHIKYAADYFKQLRKVLK